MSHISISYATAAAVLERVYCTNQSGPDLNCIEGDKTEGFGG